MRVAFLVSWFPVLSETFILNQIAGLVRRGHNVEIFSFSPARAEEAHEDVDRLGLSEKTHYYPTLAEQKLKRILMTGRFVIRSPRLLGKALIDRDLVNSSPLFQPVAQAHTFLDHERYDIAHCHYGPNGLLAVVLREIGIPALQCPVVTTFHGHDVNLLPRLLGESVYGRLFAKGECFTTSSRFLGGRLENLGCDSSRLVRLPVGVDLGSFRFRRRHKDRGKPVRVLSVARLVPVKGLEFGIRALARLSTEHPEIEYRIIGEGPEKDKLASLVAELGLSSSVQLLGAQTQAVVAEELERAHIFLAPSVVSEDGQEESQGMSLLEAQACGIPVLSTLTGGIPESVVDGKSAVLVRAGDDEHLARGLKHLIDRSDQWPEMGVAGRRHIEQQFDIEKLNSQMIEMYHQVLDS